MSDTITIKKHLEIVDMLEADKECLKEAWALDKEFMNMYRKERDEAVNDASNLVSSLALVRLALSDAVEANDKAMAVVEYMGDKNNWYVDKGGWMVLLRPRDTYKAGEASAYIEPWIFALTAMGEKEGE